MRSAGRIYRPATLAAIFGSYFALVMFESWTFASALPSPWYGPDLSRWVYMSFIVASAVFLMGAGILAFHIENALENRIREVNRELGRLLWDTKNGIPSPATLPMSTDEDEAGEEDERDDLMAQDLDEMLEVLGEAQAEAAQGVLAESSDGTVEEADPVEATRAAMLHRFFLRRRLGLKRHQDFLIRFLLGPVGVAVGILGISMAMLPASDGMLQTSYHLNSALILGFAYGWPGLAAYFAASVLGAVASLRTEKKRRIRRTSG